MKIVDLNVLLYAVNAQAESHAILRPWWERALSGEEAIALPWAVVLGFLRLSTHHSVFDAPLTLSQAVQRVERWLALDHVALLGETSDHWPTLRKVLEASGSTGNLVSDAHLAALAISRGATLVSCDTDFGRFSGLRWENPLTGSEYRTVRDTR